MAGGFKHFGPTYPTTDFVRLGYEGTLNGMHDIDPALVTAAQQTSNGEADMELAGRFAAIGADGVKLAAKGGADAVGLFREDLHDMVNASGKASFYFRGGEYFILSDRIGAEITEFKVGDGVTSDASGKIVKAADSDVVLGIVTYIGGYTNGNMYQWSNSTADNGQYLGITLKI